MSHTPYGYRIDGGQAVIDENAAAVIRKLYSNYLSGMALKNAAADAGLETYHGTAKRIMQNRHYLGDDFYPAIIDQETFDAVTAEIERRAGSLGRLNRTKKTSVITVPTEFLMRKPEQEPPNPIERAEYLYSLIERKVIQYGTR